MTMLRKVQITLSKLSTIALLLPQIALAQKLAADDPNSPENLNQVDDIQTVHGVQVAIRVYALDAAKARAALAVAMPEVTRLLDKLDAKAKQSEAAAINASAGAEEVLLSEEVYQLVTRSLDLCRRSNGAYDPTVATYDFLWNFALRPFVRPLPDEIVTKRQMVGCAKVLLKPGNHAMRLMNPGTRFTFAGVLNGFLLERAADALRRAGVDAFRIRIGRDTFVQGRVGTRHWFVDVPLTRRPNDTGFQLYLTSHAAVTVSDSDRMVVKNGKRFHDVLDPRTGQPAEGVVQATVIATDPTMAAAMAHAIFVLGPKAGLALLAKEKQADAFLVDSAGKIWATPGMSEFARLPAKVSTVNAANE